MFPGVTQCPLRDKIVSSWELLIETLASNWVWRQLFDFLVICTVLDFFFYHWCLYGFASVIICLTKARKVLLFKGFMLIRLAYPYNPELSPYLKVLHLITGAKSLSPCKVTNLQIRRVGHGHPWGAIILLAPCTDKFVLPELVWLDFQLLQPRINNKLFETLYSKFLSHAVVYRIRFFLTPKPIHDPVYTVGPPCRLTECVFILFICLGSREKSY